MAKKKKKGNQPPPVSPATAADPSKRDVTRLDSASFRVFSGLTAVAFLAGLLAMNDATSIWHGAEAWNLWRAMSETPSSWLNHFQHAVYDDGPLSVFYMRFFGVFFFLLALVATFFIGRRLFGKNTIWLSLLLLGASLLVPNIAKRASTDIYLFSAQLLFGMSTLMLLKSATLPWRLLWWGSWWLSFALEPLGSLFFALPLLLLLARSHPQGRNLRDWRLWSPALIGLGLLLVWQAGGWLDRGLSFGWQRSGYLYYLGWQLIALLPFIGFVLGGIRDLFYKLRRGEEFSLLLGAWILAALLSQSLTLSWALALLAARQIPLYFDAKYPFASWVRAPAILHLIVVFFALAGGLIFTAFELSGGFRALLPGAGLYWGMSFLGVIGLFGYNHRLLIGGPVLAGVLLTLLFWLQAGPLLESKRHWAPELVERAEALQSEDNPESLLLYYPSTEVPFPSMAVYGLDKMRQVQLLTSEAALQSAVTEKEGILILQDQVIGSLEDLSSPDTLSGWNDQLENVQYQLVDPR